MFVLFSTCAIGASCTIWFCCLLCSSLAEIPCAKIKNSGLLYLWPRPVFRPYPISLANADIFYSLCNLIDWLLDLACCPFIVRCLWCTEAIYHHLRLCGKKFWGQWPRLENLVRGANRLSYGPKCTGPGCTILPLGGAAPGSVQKFSPHHAQIWGSTPIWEKR